MFNWTARKTTTTTYSNYLDLINFQGKFKRQSPTSPSFINHNFSKFMWQTQCRVKCRWIPRRASPRSLTAAEMWAGEKASTSKIASQVGFIYSQFNNLTRNKSILRKWIWESCLSRCKLKGFSLILCSIGRAIYKTGLPAHFSFYKMPNTSLNK